MNKAQQVYDTVMKNRAEHHRVEQEKLVKTLLDVDSYLTSFGKLRDTFFIHNGWVTESNTYQNWIYKMCGIPKLTFTQPLLDTVLQLEYWGFNVYVVASLNELKVTKGCFANDPILKNNVVKLKVTT